MSQGSDVSVVMAVYDGVAPRHLSEALESLLRQTLSPEEVVVVADGLLTSALDDIIDDFSAKLPMRVVRLPERSGSARARNSGLRTARHRWVAIADADDISAPDRLSHQLGYARQHGLDLVGSAMEEFDDLALPLGVRRFPAGHDELVALMASRNPFNHPSVMMRRSLAAQIGGYRELPLLEDYDFVARMVRAGGRVGNCDACLVRFRGGDEALRRRRSLNAIKAEWALQRSLRDAGLITWWRMPMNWVLRNAFRVAPMPLARFAYRAMFLAGGSAGSALAQRPVYDEFNDMRDARAPIAALLARQVVATTSPHHLRPAGELDVLDVGSGYGHTAFQLALEYRTVTGLEPARALHDEALRMLHGDPQPNLTFTHGRVEELEAEQAYDLVVLDNVYEHLPDQQSALAAISRALRPGGIIYIVVPNKWWPIEAHYRLPLLSWLPLGWANAYLRLSGRGSSYEDASYAPTFRGLRRQLASDPTLDVRFVLPGDPAATVSGSPLHYRVGMRLLARFPALWSISKALMVVVVKRSE